MNMMLHVAKALGCRLDEVDDALRRETTLSRRNLFLGGAALAAGTLLVGGPLPLYVFTNDYEWYVARNLDEAYGLREDWNGTQRDDDDESGYLVQLSPRSRISIYIDGTGGIAPVDEGIHTLALTAAAWALREGPGFLCTTEY